MKKLRISVDGKQYDVEVEVLLDDDDQILPSYYQQSPPVNFGNRPAPAPAPAMPQRQKKQNTHTGDDKTVTSPINGTVLEIPIAVGQEVSENQTLIVLEAMKMKTNISSPFPGEVASIKIKVGDNIESGQVLVTFK